MSKVGQEPIEYKDSTEISMKGSILTVEGKEGEVKKEIPSNVDIEIDEENNIIKVDSSDPAFWGTFRSIIDNMVEGVEEGFKKELEVEGVGYRARIEGSTLVLEIGYSSPVEMEIPEELDVEVEDQEDIIVEGTDKELVGQFAANVRSTREPDAYKGKGVRYKDEELDLKPGKQVAEEGI